MRLKAPSVSLQCLNKYPLNPCILQPLSDPEVASGQWDLTVYLGAPPAEPTLLGLAPLEQAIVNVSDKLLQLRERCVHQVGSGFAQYPRPDPVLRRQGHHQEHYRAHAQCRGHREGYPLPQRRHLMAPWWPRNGNTTPGSGRDATLAISLIQS